MAAVVLAIDAGTTGVRTVAVDADGAAVGFAYREFPQHFPRPGWVEHDADDIWRAVHDTLAEVVARSRRPHRRRDRHHRPARDGRRVGPVHRSAAATAPSCGRTAAPRRAATTCAWPASSRWCGRARGWCSTRTSPPPSSSGCSREGGVGADADLAFGTVDSWVLWNLTGGRTARDRAVERQPHHALRHRPRRVVRRAARRCSACRARACPRCARAAAASGSPTPTAPPGCACPSRASPATSRRRCSARRASPPA